MVLSQKSDNASLNCRLESLLMWQDRGSLLQLELPAMSAQLPGM